MSGRRLGGVVTGGLLVVVLVAWLLPVSVPAPRDARADGSFGALPQVPSPEDLAGFVDVGRWGVSLGEISGRIAAAERGDGETRLNAALKALGYVGLLVQADINTVLVTTTDGTVVRLKPGDALPDGRVLVEVARNSITLRAADGVAAEEDGAVESGAVEVLELFPRPSSSPIDAEPVSAGGETRVDSRGRGNTGG